MKPNIYQNVDSFLVSQIAGKKSICFYYVIESLWFGNVRGKFHMEKLTEFLEQIKNLIFKVGDMSVCDQYKVMEKPHSKTKPGGRTLRYSA